MAVEEVPFLLIGACDVVCILWLACVFIFGRKEVNNGKD